ncbi:MAG: phosphoribosylamine--glycine ligase [Chloroflexota bacterium]
MKILVIGGGAREHALAWKIAQSPRVQQLFIAPGNAGTARLGTNLPIKASDLQSLTTFARNSNIDLTVVGPEAPLAAGIVDLFTSKGLSIFGPSKAAAQIESSKVFSKNLMQKYGIPCAAGAIFDSYAEASKHLESLPIPVVIKADGLAAGKGVTVAQTRDEAQKALSEAMVTKVFGNAGNRVIIEECLTGHEVSLLALSDGDTVLPLVPACDYKRVFDNDRGPNTGGMGSYSPPGFFGDTEVKEATEKVLKPTVRAMSREAMPYKGVLYAGLMMTPRGMKVLEFNARFGDPETQAILPRMKSDIVDAIMAVVEGSLNRISLDWSRDACVGVVMASSGYPGSYKTGLPITGLDKVDKEIAVFHAGTKLGDTSDRALTDGGRVLTVTAVGHNISQAREKVYSNIVRIQFEGCHYRRDIALREVK